MNRKGVIIGGTILGSLACLIILIWPAALLWQNLGGNPVCIQGTWPDIKITACPSIFQSVVVTPLPTPIGQMPVPIIVDDDGSPDGVIALLYILRNPHFIIRAVTISYGEAHPDVFAPQIARVLAGLGRSDIPVGVGRGEPLQGNNAFPDAWRESSDQFWSLDLPEGENPQKPVPAASLMVETITRSDQPVVLLVTGAQTNLAEALRLQPQIAEKIRDVYVMGGSISVPGNIESDWSSIHNRVAEWNIWVDPLAAQEVFASGLPIHLVPLDATRQVVWGEEDIAGWTSSDSLEAGLAGPLSRRLLSMSPQGRAYIWDLVAAVQADNPSVCPEVPISLQVNATPGAEQGRTVKTDGEPNASVCLNPDPDQVKALAASVLGH